MSLLATLLVTATCYHAVAGQCNEDYLTTASGAKICSTDFAYQHRYLAVSRDLLDDYPYGSVVWVGGCSVEEYNGPWWVEDTMNRRYTGCIDFLVEPGMKLLKESVTIYGDFKDVVHEGKDR